LVFDGQHGQSQQDSDEKKQEKDGPNIYELPVEIGDVLGGRQTRVKVLIQWPNGNTDVRIPSGEDTDTINLLKNIALKRWKEAASCVWKHNSIKPEMLNSLQKIVNNECKSFCSSDSILKGNSPEELISFSNALLQKEIKIECPTWHCCLIGAVGVGPKQEPEQSAINSIYV
jgi:hypothetical protein